MLSCPSSDCRLKMPLEGHSDAPNEMGHQILPGMDSQTLTENASLSRNPGLTFDPDLYWEMNYHESAIFLEVIMTLS